MTINSSVQSNLLKDMFSELNQNSLPLEFSYSFSIIDLVNVLHSRRFGNHVGIYKNNSKSFDFRFTLDSLDFIGTL